MSQTYPAVLPSTLKVTDGTALANTTGTYATPGTNTPAFEPDTYPEKVTAHPAGDPDFVLATAITKACNMPY